MGMLESLRGSDLPAERHLYGRSLQQPRTRHRIFSHNSCGPPSGSEPHDLADRAVGFGKAFPRTAQAPALEFWHDAANRMGSGRSKDLAVSGWLGWGLVTYVVQGPPPEPLATRTPESVPAPRRPRRLRGPVGRQGRPRLRLSPTAPVTWQVVAEDGEDQVPDAKTTWKFR
jgi:hypothetical protein